MQIIIITTDYIAIIGILEYNYTLMPCKEQDIVGRIDTRKGRKRNPMLCNFVNRMFQAWITQSYILCT